MLFIILSVLFFIELAIIKLGWRTEFVCNYTYKGPCGTYKHNAVKFNGIVEIQQLFIKYKSGIEDFEILTAHL